MSKDVWRSSVVNPDPHASESTPGHDGALLRYPWLRPCRAWSAEETFITLNEYFTRMVSSYSRTAADKFVGDMVMALSGHRSTILTMRPCGRDGDRDDCRAQQIERGVEGGGIWPEPISGIGINTGR